MEPFELTLNPILDDIERIIVREAGSIVHYARGEVIFAAGDIPDRIYLIERGWTKTYRLSTDGKKVTVGSIRCPGHLMGLAETLLEVERTCFAGAVSNVSMSVLTKRQFEDLLSRHPVLGIKINKLLGSRMREAEGLIHEMVCWQAPGRLARTLMKMGSQIGRKGTNGIILDIELTHEEIASMVGVSRQTVTSLLNTFKKEQSIAYEGRSIRIVNPDKLNKWVV
ncbi:MAG: Crp/Fnr family transcriptional regulator [Firmicutes bacterium]|nr:Crp/Fnr family transcriptional regulator [Bacillota bacterium]